MLGEVISAAGPNHMNCCDSQNFMAKFNQSWPLSNDFNLHSVHIKNQCTPNMEKNIVILNFISHNVIKGNVNKANQMIKSFVFGGTPLIQHLTLRAFLHLSKHQTSLQAFCQYIHCEIIGVEYLKCNETPRLVIQTGKEQHRPLQIILIAVQQLVEQCVNRSRHTGNAD